MRKMQEQILASIAGVEDGLEQVARGIMAFLSFFADHPEYVELLIQERAQFKDRKRPTYFEHREVNVQRWRKLYARLIAEGRVRDIPVEQITDVVGNLIYGTMFTNFFAGQAKPVEQQAQEILDIVFRGILTEPGTRSSSRPTRAGHCRVSPCGTQDTRGFSCRTDLPGGSDTHGSPLVWCPLDPRRCRRCAGCGQAISDTASRPRPPSPWSSMTCR